MYRKETCEPSGSQLVYPTRDPQGTLEGPKWDTPAGTHTGPVLSRYIRKVYPHV